MRRMLAVAVATSLLGVARAGEPPGAADGGEAGAPAGKAAEAGAKPGKKEKDGKATGRKVRPPERKGEAKAGEAKPGAEKPCEPIRPCPVE